MSLKSEPGERCGKHPKADDEAVDGSEGPLVQDIFSILLVRKEILKNLSVTEILMASLVCKEWRDYCRETLQEDRRCVAKLEGESDFEDLKEFGALVETSDYIPFNGLAIAVHPPVSGTCIGIDKSEALKVASKILSGVECKFLSIRVDGIPDRCNEECPYMSFLRDILRESAGSVVELSFVGDYFKCQDNVYLNFLGIYDEGFLLPNLRSLQFPSTLGSLEHYYLLILEDVFPKYHHVSSYGALQRFITVAPKLEELTGSMVTDNMGFLLSRDLTRLVKEYHILSTEPHLYGMYEFAVTAPKLLALEFSRDLRGSENDPAMQGLKLMLESSRKSLKMLEIMDADLGRVALRWDYIPVLENVEHLRLAVGQIMNFWHEGTSALRMLDWGKYLPNLRQVCVDYNTRDMCRYEMVWKDVRNSPCEYACNSVTELVFSKPFFPRGAISKIQPVPFKKIFPNVKVCWINQSYNRRCMDLSELWFAWPSLEEICLFGLSPSCANYMKDFMGISKEEATFLRKDADVPLESLELVPARPNILYFEKLKKLVVQFDHENKRNGGTPSGDEIFLPREVCSWMFFRMPELVMEIDTFCRLFGHSNGRGDYCGLDGNLDHLLQFGKIIRHDFRPYF